jgi:calpain-15
MQGSLGNCYFLSALSAMAEKPQRVKKLFEKVTVNQYGCYAVKFWINGKHKEVIIDDLIPCFPTRSSSSGFIPAFSRSRGSHELWVPLLEKCWAKINGSY